MLQRAGPPVLCRQGGAPRTQVTTPTAASITHFRTRPPAKDAGLFTVSSCSPRYPGPSFPVLLCKWGCLHPALGIKRHPNFPGQCPPCPWRRPGEHQADCPLSGLEGLLGAAHPKSHQADGDTEATWGGPCGSHRAGSWHRWAARCPGQQTRPLFSTASAAREEGWGSQTALDRSGGSQRDLVLEQLAQAVQVWAR